MPAKLKEHHGTFRAPVGSTITVEVRSDKPASTVRIIYAGQHDGAAPFQFTVKPGVNKLLAAAIGVRDGQEMRLVELDGAVENALRSFFWTSTSFHTTVNIEGI